MVRLPYLIKKSIISLSFLAIFLLNSTALAEDKILAIVNNEIITQKDMDDFARFMNMQLSSTYQGKELETQLEIMKKDMLISLIDDKLILQEAKKINFPLYQGAIDAQLDKMRARYSSDIEFQSELSAQGLTQSDIVKKMKERMLIRGMVESKIEHGIKVQPKEVTDFYEQNKDDFIVSERRVIRSIVLKDKKQMRKASSLLVKKGLSFDQIAKELDLSVNEIGPVRKGQLREELEKVVFRLRVGRISKMVTVQDISYVFYLEKIIPPSSLTLSEASDRIYNYLYEMKLKQAMQRWLNELKKKSYIAIK